MSRRWSALFSVCSKLDQSVTIINQTGLRTCSQQPAVRTDTKLTQNHSFPFLLGFLNHHDIIDIYQHLQEHHCSHSLNSSSELGIVVMCGITIRIISSHTSVITVISFCCNSILALEIKISCLNPNAREIAHWCFSTSRTSEGDSTLCSIFFSKVVF